LVERERAVKLITSPVETTQMRTNRSWMFSAVLVGSVGCGTPPGSSPATQTTKPQPGSENVSRDVQVFPGKGYFKQLFIHDGSRRCELSAHSRGGDRFDFVVLRKEELQAFFEGGPSVRPLFSRPGITDLESAEVELGPGDYLIGPVNSEYARSITVSLKVKVLD
jgi:hypothetical protein